MIIGQMTNASWPEPRLSALLALTERGLSASQCAIRLGTTRNAVLGKLWRQRRVLRPPSEPKSKLGPMWTEQRLTERWADRKKKRR